MEEKLNEGFVVVQEDEKDGKYYGGKRYYLKFLLDGKFLGFFATKEIKTIPIFYFKLKYIKSIEDFFNGKPNLVLVDYEDEEEKSIVFVINEIKIKEKWIDDINVLKGKYEDMEDAEEEDYGLTELETKYLLTEAFENDILESKLKNYDYSKHLMYDYFNLVDEVYDYDETTKRFKVNDTSRYLFYSNMKYFQTKKKYSTKDKVTLNEAEISVAGEFFMIVALSKQLPMKSDEVNLELCEKMTKSKKIAKWQAFDYFFIFKLADIKSNKKSIDSIKPYQFLIDLTEWDDISFMDSNKLAVQISSGQSAYVFIFNNVIECRRFYYFAKKAQENLREFYKMKKHSIKINVDFCKLFESLVKLETVFKVIVHNLFERGAITDKKKVLYNFSMSLNSFFVGFNCKTTFEPKYLAIFLKVYENYFFEKITENLVVKMVKKKRNKGEEPEDEGVVEFKLQTPSKILNLINAIKFHEEILRRWNIVDLRILGAEKVLEEIYTKLHFNLRGVNIIQIMMKINTNDNFYYKGKKKVSTVIINLFDEVKAMVVEMKSNRKDKDFKLELMKIIRRGIHMVLANLEFIGSDPNIKINLENWPSFINSLLEIEERILKMLKFITDKYHISSRYLKKFFCKKYTQKKIKVIQEKVIKLYQLILTRDIDQYFKVLESLEFFNIREYYENHLKMKIEVSNEFLPEFNNVSEYAAVYSTMSNFLEYVANKYKSCPDKFEIFFFKKKLAEFQGKINSLQLNDQMTKVGIFKIIRCLEQFFLSDENVSLNAYNISFVLGFKENYSVLTDLIGLKEFQNEKIRTEVLDFIKISNYKFKRFHSQKINANKLYRGITAITVAYKFARKLLSVYRERKEKMENSEEDEEEEEEEAPSDVPKKIIILRYFPYKKTSKQNYGYIKNKIKILQFDPAFVETSKGNLYIKDKTKTDLIIKVLMLSKITFLEKFEQIYLTIYYRHNMILIMEFPNESENNAYLKTLSALVDYHRNKKMDLPNIQVSDQISSKKDLKNLYLYNIKLKFDFVYSHLFSDTKLFSYWNAPTLRYRGIMQISFYEHIENLKKIALENGQTFDPNKITFDEDKIEFKHNANNKQTKREITRRKSGDFLKKYDYRKLARELNEAKKKQGG